MENMNQDPAQQLALLLDSPNLKHLGAERIDGVASEHYKGTLTIDEMMKSNKMLDTLKPEERQQLLTNMKKTGVQGTTPRSGSTRTATRSAWTST